MKSSAPANITKLSATPKDAPITILVAPEPELVKIPPIENINIIPNPIYSPAKTLLTIYPILLFLSKETLFFPAFATACTSSLNIIYSP